MQVFVKKSSKNRYFFRNNLDFCTNLGENISKPAKNRKEMPLFLDL
jgi:hypothetical protein